MRCTRDSLVIGSVGALKELLLYGNQIGDEEVKAFSTAIASGSLAKMEALRLDSNQIARA